MSDGRQERNRSFRDRKILPFSSVPSQTGPSPCDRRYGKVFGDAPRSKPRARRRPASNAPRSSRARHVVRIALLHDDLLPAARSLLLEPIDGMPLLVKIGEARPGLRLDCSYRSYESRAGCQARST